MTNNLSPELQTELDRVNDTIRDVSSYSCATELIPLIEDALDDVYERAGIPTVCVGIPSSSEIYLSAELARALVRNAEQARWSRPRVGMFRL